MEDNTASQSSARVSSYQALSFRWPNASSQVVLFLVNLSTKIMKSLFVVDAILVLWYQYNSSESKNCSLF